MNLGKYRRISIVTIYPQWHWSFKRRAGAFRLEGQWLRNYQGVNGWMDSQPQNRKGETE